MKRLVIADSHLGQRRGDTEAMTALLECGVERGVGEVIYLGDAFQYLIGMSKFWTSAVNRVLGTWQRVRQGGARVVLIEGNRDFFLDEPDLAPYVDWSGLSYDFDAGGRSYRLTHGDRVNRRDHKYLFWSAVSKSWPARLWARLLPRRIAVSIVRSMEAKLARTNTRFRYRKPVEALQAEARRAWDDGVDVMLWGHFHSSWELAEGSRLAMLVPGWLETRSAIVVDSDGSWTFVDASLTRVGSPHRIASNGNG